MLKFPVLAVNDSDTKHLFDNRYGTGQSTVDAIIRATNLLLAGRNFVVAGYGWCGKGVASRARGMGANVIVTEVDPVRAIEAVMDGFRVMPMAEAAEIGDIFVTVTGDINVIDREHFERMKDGAVIANSRPLQRRDQHPGAGSAGDRRPRGPRATSSRSTPAPTDARVYLLAEGRLVNLSAAEGHPASVMDMSFANQALGAEYMLQQGARLAPEVYTSRPRSTRRSRG